MISNLETFPDYDIKKRESAACTRVAARNEPVYCTSRCETHCAPQEHRKLNIQAGIHRAAKVLWNTGERQRWSDVLLISSSETTLFRIKNMISGETVAAEN